MKKSFCLKILFAVALLSLAMICLGACSGDPYAEPSICNGNHTYGAEHYSFRSGPNNVAMVAIPCTVCGEEYTIDAAYAEHTFESYKSEGNCQTTVEITYECTICNWSYKEDGGYGSHNWSGSSTAMCGGDGYFERTCSVCGDSESGTMIGLQHDIAHRDGELPDCDSEGWKPYDECMRCGYDTYVSIPATDHPNASWVVTLTPTETTKGIREFHCTDCGVEERIEMPETIYTDGLIYETYDYTTGELMVVGIDRRVSPNATVISVPKTYNGKAITYIADCAFENDTLITEINLEKSQITAIGLSSFRSCSALTTVKLGQDTKAIKEYAFEDCGKLENVNFMNVERICLHAFKGTGIKNLVLPSTLQTIESEAFIDCKSLKTATISDGTSFIGNGVFKGCTAIESLTVPFIGENSEETRFRHVVYLFDIEDDVTADASFDRYAAVIPSTLKSITVTSDSIIDKSAFRKCASLEKIVLPDGILPYTNLNRYGWDFEGCDNLTFNEYNGCRYIASVNNPYYLLVGASNNSITEIVMHEDTAVINGEAFKDNNVIKSVIISGSIIYMGDSAFENCVNLQSVTMEEGVREIGDYAFRNCTSLGSVTMAATLTSIGHYSFYGCTSLYSIDIPARVNYIGGYAFRESALAHAYFHVFDGWTESRHTGDHSFDNDLTDSGKAAYLLTTTYYGTWKNI